MPCRRHRFIVLLLSMFALAAMGMAASSQPDILLVRDAHNSYVGVGNPNEVYGQYYENALQNNSLDYDVCTIPGKNDDGPLFDGQGGCTENIGGMQDYEMVIWFTGDDYGSGSSGVTLTSRDREELTRYLNQSSDLNGKGGSLFLSGQDIGYDIGTTAFYQDWLKARWCDDDTDDLTLTGDGSDPVGDSLALDISGGADNQIWPDSVFDNDGTLSDENAFAYREDVTGSLSCDSGSTLSLNGADVPGALKTDTGGPAGYKTVYFSFGFEAIAGSAKRETVMRRIVHYLTGPETRKTVVDAQRNDTVPSADAMCIPGDKCLKEQKPLVTATCHDRQLFSNISAAVAEFDDNPVAVMNASDGAYDEPVEDVNGTLNTDFSGKISDYYEVAVQCKDGDGYWGRFGNTTLRLDRAKPSNPSMAVWRGRYVNRTKPVLNLSYSGSIGPPFETINFTRFSCGGSSYGNWTDWTAMPTTGSDTNRSYTGFDLTAGAGCGVTDGNRSVQVQARDVAGNYDPDAETTWVVLDRVAPNVTVNGPSPVPARGDVGLNVTVADSWGAAVTAGVSNVRYVLRNETWTSVPHPMNGSGTFYTATLDTTTLKDGNYTVIYRGTDRAGNTNATRRVEIAVDNTPPLVAIVEPLGGTFSGTIELAAEVVDPHRDTVRYSLRNTSNLSEVFQQGTLSCPGGIVCSGSWDSTADVPTTGQVLFNVTGNDTLGWNNSRNATFFVDNRQPSVKIQRPARTYEASSFNLSLRTRSPGAPTVNISNTYYNITNATATWSRSNRTVASVGAVDQATFNFTERVNISTLQDGNYSLFFWSNNTEGRQANRSTWFVVDTTPPATSPPVTNLSIDPLGGRRVFSGEPIAVTANVSDAWRPIADVRVTLERPNGSTVNRTLTATGTADRWRTVYTPRSTGRHTLTAVFANDSLGNRFANSSLETEVRLVNVTLDVGTNGTTDAGRNTTLTATFTLNRTRTAPTVTVYLPPNTPGDTGNEPLYDNVTAYRCGFGTGCTASVTATDVGVPTVLTLNGTGTGATFTLNATIRAGTPVNDTNATWLVPFRSILRRNTTRVTAPSLNVSGVGCGGGACVVNQSERFNLSFVVEALTDATHTGDAYGVTATINASWQETTNTTDVGRISAGANRSVNRTFTIEETGNYTITITARDATGTYVANATTTVTVQDITPPAVRDVYWRDDNVFNRNRTVAYRVEAEDNGRISLVTARIERGAYVENVSLDLGQRFDTFDRWTLSYRNVTPGRYNISPVFVNDTSTNTLSHDPSMDESYFEIRGLGSNISVSNTTIGVGGWEEVMVNVTGNASRISSVAVTVEKPRGVQESVDASPVTFTNGVRQYRAAYQNVTRSGSYVVRANVSLSSGVFNTVSDTFTVPEGDTTIRRDPIQILSGRTRNVSWTILPTDGDLIDVNATLSIANTSAVNLSAGETADRQPGNITWERYNETGRRLTWSLNASNVTATTNVTLTVNASSDNASRTVTLDVIPEDPFRPNITGVAHVWPRVNRLQANTITVNVTDNRSAVDTVRVQIDYPLSGEENRTATETVGGGFSLAFANTNETTNATHRFAYTVFAEDLAGNVVSRTVPGQRFNVTARYDTLDIERAFNPFNKGNNLSFTTEVSSVNGQTVTGFNQTLVLERGDQNVTLVNDTRDVSDFYRIESGDAPQPDTDDEAGDQTATYTVFTTVSKDGNTGQYSETFTVTEDIPTKILEPQSSEAFASGTRLNVTVRVRDAHNETIPSAAVTARCNNCPEESVRLTWDEATGTYRGTEVFTVPDQDFTITASAVDVFRNEDDDFVGLFSGTGGSGGGGGGSESGGGGGGGGGGGAVLPSLEITQLSPDPADPNLPASQEVVNISIRTDVEAQCRYAPAGGALSAFSRTGGTFHATRVEAGRGTSYYTVSCTGSNGATENATVVFSRAAGASSLYGITLPGSISGVQGRTVPAAFSLLNNQSTAIRVGLQAEASCCTVAFYRDDAEVDVVRLAGESERVLTMQVAIPLSTEAGQHALVMRFDRNGTVRERTMNLDVTRHPEVARLAAIKADMQEIRQRIDAYREAGINTSAMERQHTTLQERVNRAENAIKRDNASALQDAVESAAATRDQARSALAADALAYTVRTNWWRWLLGGMGVYVVFFLVTVVALPYLRLRIELNAVNRKLENEVGARKKAEKQYFQREISRDVYMDIATKKQNRILELRSERDDMVEDMNAFVRDRLSLGNILAAPLRAVEEVELLVSALREWGEDEEDTTQVREGTRRNRGR